MKLSFSVKLRQPSGFTLDASFEARDGVTALFGPSGAGKTTVLELIAGLLRPTEGRIELEGRVLVDTATGAWVPPEERSVGYAFQDALLFPHVGSESTGTGFGSQVAFSVLRDAFPPTESSLNAALVTYLPYLGGLAAGALVHQLVLVPRARRAIDAHRARFADGRLRDERTVVEIRWLLRSGRRAEARQAADQFRVDRPKSLLRPAVDRLLPPE